MHRAVRDRFQIHPCEPTVEDILAKLAGLSTGDIVIPLASAVDSSGRHHDFSSVIQRMAKVSAAPLFDIESQRVKGGITIGGSVEDGVTQGRVAAGMGLRILAGTRARDIPVASPERLLMFSYPVLQRYGIPESRLPAGSVLVGKPPGLYAQYRGIVWATGLALLALVVVIGILIVNIRRRRQAEAVLEQSEEHLRLALDGTTDAAWDWNMQSGAVYVSPRSFTMLGYEPGGFPLTTLLAVVHPDDPAEAERPCRRVSARISHPSWRNSACAQRTGAGAGFARGASWSSAMPRAR
jgi:PAS domain-containing protein